MDRLAFGHKFHDRLNSPGSDESSPVFIQFLDCTWQLLDQFPTSFEFGNGYLVTLATHSKSGTSTYISTTDFIRHKSPL